MMRSLISMALLVALLGGRPTIAQTIGSTGSSAQSASANVPPSPTRDTRLIGAPIGHRQPHVRDVPSENAGDLEHIGEEDAAIDRMLHICRGC
jgi:hypothetical protein